MGPLFGKTFDLDGDGHVAPEEELFGYTMMRRQQEEQTQLENSQTTNSTQNYSEAFSDSDFDVENWYDIKPEIPKTSEVYYPCGLLSYQSFSGFPCSGTITLDNGTQRGYIPVSLGVFKYNKATRKSFDDYIVYIKSKGALVHDYDNDQDLGYTSYTFFFTSEGKVWILDVICQWEYGCDVEVRISGGGNVVSSESNTSLLQESSKAVKTSDAHADNLKKIEDNAVKPLEEWPTINSDNASDSDDVYYPCGLLSYQSFSGFPCSKTITRSGTKIDTGYVPTILGSHKYEAATRESFDDYISYIKSKGALVHDCKNDYDLGRTTYTFHFKSDGKLWILDVICQWKYGCDIEVCIVGGLSANRATNRVSRPESKNKNSTSVRNLLFVCATVLLIAFLILIRQ